jgi:cysteine desulfurase
LAADSVYLCAFAMDSPVPRLIYLDNNATTPIAPEVFEAMVPYLTESFGNPSSTYRLGRESAQAVKRAREQIAALVKADPREMVLTSCGTESDNAAIMSALHTTRKKHIVTTQVEHSAVEKFCQQLEKRGHAVTWLPVDGQGRLDLGQLEQSIRPDTAIVSIMWANNETGVLFPVEEIAAICRRKEVLFHTDAVQCPGKIPIDLSRLPADFVSFSGHKLHAPKGVGALFVRRQTKFAPFVTGGGQEGGKRGGTENVAAIVGLGRAAELALENLVDEQTRVRGLRELLESDVLARIPGTAVNGDREQRLPNTTNMVFEGVEAEGLLMQLDLHGICASAGSACTTGSMEPSHVLSAMGLPAARARSSIRFSLSTDNTQQDIEALLAVLPGIISRLRDPQPATAGTPAG